MSDTLLAIIAIFVAAILMFIFPLMAVASQNDEIAQIAVQTIVSNFVNRIAQEGKITQDSYNEFVQKLHATGNVYSIELEAKILDQNPSRKVTMDIKGYSDKIGEDIYYSNFTNEIMNKLENDGIYLLKKGDYITVSVKNINLTIGTQLKNFLYNIIGKDSYTIGATASTKVANTGTALSIT